jgi:hypothetical protein
MFSLGEELEDEKEAEGEVFKTALKGYQQEVRGRNQWQGHEHTRTLSKQGCQEYQDASCNMNVAAREPSGNRNISSSKNPDFAMTVTL